ncbi:expressed unknown protein [Seminavis robusta]|uniref:Uncharacterized protein n=1 Tax=Seminavis robusta TaxID=568900 RepID=A0A9N8H0Z9_9STRA|nr:expressed unknown protein [Seminavis robusta]|eukprot:Sro30_g019800.1 n/a (375) ;mRNA; f:130075-131544
MSGINRHAPSKEEMDAVFALCRKNHWASCLQCLKTNPLIGITAMVMDNHIATTVCHQAITSKGDVQARAEVILQILSHTPEAATIANGYGSLCLHCACQRNVKMNAKTKERVIMALITAYPEALAQAGGVGQRTPLHIVFTDYVSPKLTRVMVSLGSKATFMKDKKGYLPLHVAVSRHVSPDKLRMLLEANPGAILEKTNEGSTVLGIAKATATKSHPNYALINALQEELKKYGGAALLATAAGVPERVGSNDTLDSPVARRQSKRKAKKGRSNITPASKRSKHSVAKHSVSTPAAADLLLHFCHTSQNIVPKTEPEEEPLLLHLSHSSHGMTEPEESLLLHFSHPSHSTAVVKTEPYAEEDFKPHAITQVAEV